MSQVSGQRPPHCEAPHGAPSAAPGPAQTPSLLPGLEVVTGSTHPAEAALEEGSLEEVAAPMPQGNSPGAPQPLDSTDLDVPTEAVTRQPQGNPLSCTPLVANGSGHPSELGSARRAGSSALGGPKAHRKLQTHPSLASQGSKKSKGSTKSTASQIPLQAQEGHLGSFHDYPKDTDVVKRRAICTPMFIAAMSTIAKSRRPDFNTGSGESGQQHLLGKVRRICLLKANPCPSTLSQSCCNKE
ncbi:myoD family inhibitor isoform X2 [Ursus americanus]|uniref:myoD family inhibitor isoform X2 n=1 Tax=Ursus americanus TaxID=9643 RepID=UPI001E67AB24|nr:myoD family inhibitor isoform X2 [Ursus americanus]